MNKYLTTSIRRNNRAVSLVNMRNTKGSTTRIYKYWSRISPIPLYDMFLFTQPIPVSPIPVPPISVSSIPVPRKFLRGFLSYSFVYNSPTSITKSLVLENIPIYTLNGIFEITPNITITNNYVYVEIETILYEETSYASELGITFYNKDLFYNNNITNTTMISTYNCPFSRAGSQFLNLIDIKILSSFKPYFLPNTSLSNCFKQCYTFNSDISGWDTSNVTTMESMFHSAETFNKNISGWNVSNVTSMNYMFYLAAEFNNGDIYNGVTSPLNWKFNKTPTNVDWRKYSGLTINNSKTEPQLSLS